MTNHLDTFFAALSDPTRRAVIERLTRGPAPVTELHAPHDIALPTFLRHLKVLEAAGLVRSEKSGRVRTVHIEALPLAEAECWLSRQRRLWEGRLDRLDALALALSAPSGMASPDTTPLGTTPPGDRRPDRSAAPPAKERPDAP